MVITLYKYKGARNVLEKSISQVGLPYECIIKGNINMTTPTIILDYNGNQLDANYAYIPEYDRYYYIEDIQMLTGGRVALVLSCDVLMSFKENIKNIVGVITRQANKQDPFYNDGRYLVKVTENGNIYPFSDGFNANGEFILITCGG